MSQLLKDCLEPHLAQLPSLCTSFSASKLPCSPPWPPSVPSNTSHALPPPEHSSPAACDPHPQALDLADPLELSFLWDASLIHPHEVGTLVCAPIVPELSLVTHRVSP